MYTDMPTGLSPEIAYFNMDDGGGKDIIVKVRSLLWTNLEALKSLVGSGMPIVWIEFGETDAARAAPTQWQQC